MTEKEWNPSFFPMLSPITMLQLGVFEGKYLNETRFKSWLKKKGVKHVSPGEPPDVELNLFGVKSRRSLSHWKEKGWIKTDKLGWFQWYCEYWDGRRLGSEDDWQIGRWRSLLARHTAQMKGGGSLIQKQLCIQWAWVPGEKFDSSRNNGSRPEDGDNFRKAFSLVK